MTAFPQHTLPIPVDPGEKPITVNATELVDIKWHRIFREIRGGGDYIILRDGEPIVAVIDYDYYLHLIMGVE